MCSDGIANEASITLSSRCGNSQGSGFCVIITPGEGLPDPLPDATNTLECPAEGMNYEVTDGGNGVCTMTDNKKPSGSVNCTQENTNNFASASCANGCGNTSGTGADCTPKSRE